MSAISVLSPLLIALIPAAMCLASIWVCVTLLSSFLHGGTSTKIASPVWFYTPPVGQWVLVKLLGFKNKYHPVSNWKEFLFER